MTPPSGTRAAPERLDDDVRLLGDALADAIGRLDGADACALVEELRVAAVAHRDGELEGGREALGRRVAALGTEDLARIANAFTDLFHLVNAAEEQHRIRVLRERDVNGEPLAGGVYDACSELRRAGAGPDDVRALLERLLVMPVLTAHPTEARRRAVLDHLGDVSTLLDRLDDPRVGEHGAAELAGALRETVAALAATAKSRRQRPTPIDEVKAGLQWFERTLLEATPGVYRTLEDALAATWPDEAFEVPTFLRYGSWIGGDRDGNPFVTADVTRAAFERHRAVALRRYRADVADLWRALPLSEGRIGSSEAARAALAELAASIEWDREHHTGAAVRLAPEGEPWREKLRWMAARLEAAQGRGEWGYPDARAYADDLRLLERTVSAAGLGAIARGRLRDARRRAEVFGFHLASLDIRQHSSVHEEVVGELLARAGERDYAARDERARVEVLCRVLAHDGLAVRDRSGLSPAARDLLATLEAVGWARRDMGPAACERYVVSFTRSPSDLLEVLLLARAAGLAPGELRPVPLLEQLEDLEQADALVSASLEVEPLRAAIGPELEVMVGYSDSGKQVGYVPSNVALHRAQAALARLAEARGLVLTIFHGRGGAVGRGGGPAGRAIRAQPREALRGRFRVTEQGETIAARFGRIEVARRELEQMLGAVLVSSGPATGADASPDRRAVFEPALGSGDAAARASYESLIGDRERLTRYVTAATPIEHVGEMRIASRPAKRGGGVRFEDLRAIPWVFSWTQSRHGLPGWYGLGTALEAIVEAHGAERAAEMYAEWPFFRGLVDNARLALVRADIGVAAEYARLADDAARSVFDLIREEHARTVRMLEQVAGSAVDGSPALMRSLGRRNPLTDVLSHVQIELLRRLGAAPDGPERDRLREALYVTMNGIAAGLMSAG